MDRLLPRNARVLGWLLGLAALTVSCLLLRLLLSASRSAPPAADSTEMPISALLGPGPDTGFAHADRPRTFAFPADHGPHEAFRSEWWYWTGNLDGAGGERFGYQFTVFRVGLRAPAPGQPVRSSAWASEQLYVAHLALLDGAHRRFLAVHDQARGACGLAGASADPFHVWVGNWSMSGWEPSRLSASSTDGIAFALELALEPGKPLVLEGDQGLSLKGAGGASYYYSLTRMPTTGSISVDGRRVAVTGSSWMDREWSTGALAANQLGWDWFALQFADGRELMLYRMRLSDGTDDPASSGTLIAADGRPEHLRWPQVRVASTGSWTSPRGGTYPAGWQVAVPGHHIDCRITPVASDQELAVGVRYWEGAVDVAGDPCGRGYVELTGYARSAADR